MLLYVIKDFLSDCSTLLCAGAFAVALTITVLIIPSVIKYALRHHRVDCPNERKIHKLPVPRMGGIAFIPVALLTATLIIGIYLRFTNGEYLGSYIQSSGVLAISSVALIITYITGIVDDFFGLRYRIKFVSQTVSACIMLVAGICIVNLGGLLGISALPQPVAGIITVIFFMGLVNSMNLIDGLDGLCASLSLIASLFFGCMAAYGGNLLLAIIAFSVSGALAGFLFFNLGGDAKKRTKIFMGDTGSLTLGLILGFEAILLANTFPGGADSSTAIVLAFIPLFIPVADAIRVFAWRLGHGRNPFLPDKNHIHHKLLLLGIGQRKALLIILSFDILLIGANVLMAPQLGINLTFAIDIAVWCIATFSLSRIVRSKKARVGD